jgi:hypothetical protein
LRALAKMLRGALTEEIDEDGNGLQQHKLEFFLSLFRNSEKFRMDEELLKAAQICVEIIQKGEISSQRFDSMLVDFAYICRSEADIDALDDYLL